MSKTNKFSVADYLLTRLKQLGLDKIFQVPGDYVAEFMDAQLNFNGIDAIGMINELEAGYAADGYARLKGIGAISVQFGVGTFSALNAVAGSYVERNPVVVITASPTTENRKVIAETGILFHHVTGKLNTDQAVYKNVTVAAEIISNAKHAPQQIDDALIQAITHSRPIYIEAYQDVWGMDCIHPKGRLSAQKPASQAASLAAMVNAAMAKIQGAKQPVFLLGIEIARFGLQTAVTELINASGIPFTTTTLAKTVLTEQQPLFIGTYADGASLADVAAYVEQSDCIITLGAILTDDYYGILTEQFAAMIVSSEQNDSARVGYQHYQNVQPADFIAELTQQFTAAAEYPLTDLKLPPQPGLITIDAQLLAAPLSYQRFFDLLNHYQVETGQIDTHNLILGESSSLYMAARLTGLPQNSFFSDAAWGSLGHETGCVAGIDFASPKRSMVIAGDGGFMMMCQALSTLSRNNLNSIVFVISNTVYAIEQSFVNICAFTPNGEFAPFDCLPKWRYKKLAAAFGVNGYKVSNGTELMAVLKKLSNNTDNAALVEVVIPADDLAPAIASLVKSITGNTVEQCKTKPPKTT